MKNQQGITLIALIITIIIMLILAAVVINLTIGENGIFKMAKTAAKNYTNAEAKELANLNNIANIVDKVLNDETEGNGGTEPSNPETPTTTIDVNSLKAGDYVKYDTGKTEVGTQGIITCRVLYPVSSEYGLQIISDKNVKDVTLGSEIYSEAVESYNNAIETLNNESEAYINTDYAYDARCVGSVPTVENGIFINKDNGTVYVELPFSNPDYIYSLEEDGNYISDFYEMERRGILETGQEYWFASRGVSRSEDRYAFSILSEDSSDAFLPYKVLCEVYSELGVFSDVYTIGLRPCISLKSNIIKITGGDGKSPDTAYVIGK